MKLSLQSPCASDGNELAVKTDGEIVWLTQDQMCLLFGRTQPVIARHIANVFKEGELPKEGFMQILHKTSTTGGRPVAMHLKHERRNAHAQAERRQGEVFGCIPHGRGAFFR